MYNPYYDPYMIPIIYQKPSLIQSMKYSINQMNLASTFQTAQKTIYTINQIIPVINQLKPIIHNASTAFRVVKAVKQFDFDDIDSKIEEPVFKNMVPPQKSISSS